ncbi:filamentous hemagglutinin N-terminal domain-containing protein, partial [uncultured Selenomonas sp.]|uniref:two-partner secretion domain-containing protein n=1 Tax=uncultured Selenomonas sp. TaxID=159275 RepID=UPI00261CEFD7
MRGMSKKDALACQVSLGLFAGLLGIASTAHGAPIADGGGAKQDGVRTGGAKIVQSGATTNITSDNTNNVIGWKDFSIKTGESVVFDNDTQTNNYLNIVTGKVTSHIDGTMKGGKNVYIANSHGVIFGDGASVDVGNLYVTTRKLDADAIGTSVKNGTIDLDAPTSAGVTGNIINGGAASSAGLAKSDIVSLVDGSGSVKATKIVLEGKSVRIMNDAKIDSSDVSAVADQSALEVNAGGMKTVRANKGYVHVGYASSAPTYGSTGKYKNLTDANMYKLVGSKADLDAIRTTAGGLAGRYMLRNDIDFGGAAHTSIGTDADPFTGKFDGMFHEIKNMTVASGSAAEYAGLFGTTNGATIMNVGLKNADLSIVQYGGGLVGHAKGKTVISGVYNESTISIGAGNDAGGLVGWLDSSSLDNAYNTADVGHGGGLVGRFDGSSKMYAVYNTGAITLGVSSSAYKIYGNNVVTTGSDVAFIKDAYTNRVELTPSVNNSIIYNSYTMDSTGTASLVMPSGTPKTGDSKQSATYEGWDISDEGGANTTWRIFAGQSTPLLTAFMKGTVQAEYSYADFQQADHAHLGNTASTYTVQAEDKKNGSYVKRLGTESNGGKDITRTYNADYLRIAHKSGDNYTHVTSVGTTDDDIKLYGAKDRSLVELNKADSQGKGGGGGRRNAGREAMLVSGQHGYDIAGANVTIAKRKVIGDVGQMGKIEREYDGTANAGDAFKAALTAGNVVVRTEGLVDGDGATMTINTDGVTFREKGNWTSGAALSPNAGYNKSIYVDSSKVNFGDADGNYEFDATKINDKKLTGNILQKTIRAKLTTDTGINKTYDGTSAVIGAAYQPNPNLVLDSATQLVASGDVELNQADVTAKYKTKATNKEAKNADAHDVAYEGIKLQNTSDPAKTKNYKLVDKDGTVLYREAIDDDPNAAVTSGTLWGTGDIKKRKIDAGAFTVSGKPKVYDGKDYLVVDGTKRKVQGTVDKEAGKAGDTGKNVIEADEDKLKFTISAADNKAYYK